MTEAHRRPRPVRRVELSSAAARGLDAIRRPMFDRVGEAIDALAGDLPRGAAERSAAECLWRIRVGDSRIVYQVGAMRRVPIPRLGRRLG